MLVVLAGCSESGRSPGAQESSGGSEGEATGGGSGGTDASGAGGASTATGGGASGGSESGGGTGGTSGGEAGGGPSVPPTQVGACSDLGKVGEWQNVFPAIQAIAPQAKLATTVAIDPVHAGTLYVGTATGEHVWGGPGQGIFKSTDCGATWKKVNTGLMAARVDEGTPWALIVDPVEPDVLYHSAGYGDNGLLKSTNGGVDWKRCTQPERTGHSTRRTAEPTGRRPRIADFRPA